MVVKCTTVVERPQMTDGTSPFDSLSWRGILSTIARFHSFAARSNAAMSSFFICIIAPIALGWRLSSPIRAGTTCQHSPNLSLSQPQAISLPPPFCSFE